MITGIFQFFNFSIVIPSLSMDFKYIYKYIIIYKYIYLYIFSSVTGKPLFKAPIGRSSIDFLKESEKHGWPSFRDQEVVWENVSILKSSGETVSNTGTHLGHNIPDKQGNRYCINIVSIAGNPIKS